MISQVQALAMCTEWSAVLVPLGLLFSISLLRNLIKSLTCGIRAYVLPTLLGPVDPTKAYGGWALVTGCTGGIGKEYALQLAAKGMDVVLVSRSKDKLDQLEKDISERFGVKTRIIVADFTRVEALAEIVTQLEGMEIGVLVNNVGVNGGGCRPFKEMDTKIVVDLITVNVTAATALCHSLIPHMVGRGKGAVINIGSICGLMQGPYLAEYSASKHYIHAFTEAIAEEYKNTGVFIQEINPGMVLTAMNENFKKEYSGSVGAPSAEKFVSWSLPTLGLTHQTCGYWAHSLQLPIFTRLPIWVLAKMLKLCYEYEKEIKEKLKKN